jgi:F-type H+-transporting ATPase subunit a
MGLEFLARVRRSTLWIAATAALMTALHAGPALGVAVASGAAWSLVNLWLLEKLVVALTGPVRDRRSAVLHAARALGGMVLLFGAGGVALLLLPPIALLAGFLIPFAVIVLKALSLLLLPSRAWQALTRSRWRAAALVGALLLAAWWVVPASLQGNAGAATSGSAAGTRAHDPPAPQDAPAPHDTAAPHAPSGGGAHGGGAQKFPNVITLIERIAPDAPWVHQLARFEVILFSALVALILVIVAIVATRHPQMVPGPLQNAVEMVVEGLSDFIIGILGEKHGPRFVPFLGTIFVYILAMNLFGMLPLMESPTASLNVTFAFGLMVFVYVQYIGIRELGVLGYLDHMAGSPRDLTSWLLVPLMLPIHLLGELAKPISLSCRLFGNIFGEDMLLVAFAMLGITALSFLHLPVGLPLQVPFFALTLLGSGLQALVFTVLTTIYILLMLPHDEHGHEADARHAH